MEFCIQQQRRLLDVAGGIMFMCAICSLEADSKITRCMRSFLNYLQSKQVAERNSTSEQEAFSEKRKKDAVKRFAYRDSIEIEAIFLSELRMILLLMATLAASVSYSLSLRSPGGFSSDNDGAHLAKGPALQATYLFRYLAIIDLALASMVVVSILVDEYLSHRRWSLWSHGNRSLDCFSIIWRLRWLRMLQALESVEAVCRGLVILGTLVAAMTYEAGLQVMFRGGHLERLMVEILCLNYMAFVLSLVILMLHLRRTATCHGYGFSSWVLQRWTGVAMIRLTAGIAIWSCRSVKSSIQFSALVVTILLCSGLEFLAFLCMPLENWGHNIREPLLHYSSLVTADLQHHRDPALSHPQESVPKWLSKLFQLPADEDEDTKSKTEKGHKLLLLLAVLAASLTYQAGLSPPGGLWQENKADHVVSNLVLNDNHRRRYMALFYCNATAFVSSMAIILLLVNRKHFARGILSNMLSVCVILDMIGLTSAFAAVGSMRAATSIKVFNLVFAVLVCIALQVLVRVGSGSLSEHSVLRRNQGGPFNFVNPDHILELIGVNAAGNCSESADPAVDDEDDRANRPIKRNNPREATWHVSCAAPHHMTGNRSLLLTGGYMPVLDSNDGEVVLVNLAGNKQAVPLRVRGSGSVRTESIALDDVWYVPGLDSNLVSTGQLARQGCAIKLGPGGCRITRGGGALVGTARFTEECQFELDFLKVDAAPSM